MKFLTKLHSDELLRHAGILFSGMMVMHVCNMVFQMAVSRALPPEEYALLAAFLGILAIIQRPLSTLTTTVSRYSSLLQQDGQTGDVKRLLKKWVLLTGIPAILFGVLVVAYNEPLAGFLHLDRVAPVIVVGALFPALFCLPVLYGAGQGLQKFGWVSAASIFGALARLLLGAGFVWFWVPACGWAMLGHGLGMYVSLAILVAALFFMLHGKKESNTPLPSLRLYLLQSFFIQAAFAVLMTADVVLVKHYIPGDSEFAYAATAGRMVMLLPGVIVMSMFPKVASRGTTTVQQRTLFFRSFGYTALCSVAAVVGCFIFSGLVARIIFGITEASAHLKWMIGSMALVMGFTALLNVTVQFLLAQHRFLPAYSLVGFGLLYLLSAFFFHEAAWQIVLAQGILSFSALVVTTVSIARGAVLPPEDEKEIGN